MLAALLAGCGQGSALNTQTTSEGTADSAESSISYAYEQELNIIDDNYRNYYEIFVASYYDSDGDGMGDLNGVTEKLDYIQDMGFNGIWLMPIMPAPSYHKYDTTDYMNIDPDYGTLEDFQTLLDEAHKRGINIVIDYVINHSSNQHPWFLEATSYLRDLPADAEPDVTECPYVDCYHFSREQINGDYRHVPGADWYYEGVFDSSQPDLNWENEAVREEFKAVADFWIGMGVDGFRMDAAMHYDDSNAQLNIDTLKWYNEYCLSLDPDFYMVSEVWAGESTIATYYASETPSMFNFPMAGSEGNLVKTARGTMKAAKFVNTMYEDQQTYGAVYADYIDAPFLTNHDQVRVANNLMSNENDLKMAAGLLLMMNGSPFVYYGEEIGMKSGGNDNDPNKRLAMYWSETDKTGKPNNPQGADSTIKPSLPAWDEQLEDETSLLNYYKRALRLRNENPEIARGEISVVDELCEEYQAAITKTYEGSTIGIVYNTSDEEMAVSISGTKLDTMGIRGYLTLNGEEITLKDGTLTMPAQSICILK